MNPTKQDDPSEEFTDELADEALDRTPSVKICPCFSMTRGMEDDGIS